MNRRAFMAVAALGGVGLAVAGGVARSAPQTTTPPRSAAGPGLAILPGQWRPYFPFEQIAWIRAPWSDVLFPEYVWLDFPEAIFTRAGLMFLSHISPHIRSRYRHLEKVRWQSAQTGCASSGPCPTPCASAAR